MDLSRFIEKFDLEKFIKENYSKRIIENSTHFVLKCPICPSRKSAKLHIEKDRKIYQCFRCGEKGSLPNFISLYSGITVKEAIDSLCDGSEVVVNDELADSLLKFFESSIFNNNWDIEPKNNLIMLPGDYRPLEFYSEESLPMQYIYKRGLTREHAEKFDIGYSQEMKRIVFPIYSNDELVGWQARSILEDEKVKALTAPGFDKSRHLFNYDNVWGAKSLIICEGPIDAVRSYKYNSVALLGKKISRIQLNLILKMNLDTIFLGLDPDAQVEADKLCDNLSGFIRDIRSLPIPSDKDLGDSTEDEIKGYLENSKRYQKKELLFFL